MALEARRVARYFYRLKDDDIITEFCVAGAVGAQSVETLMPDGSHRKWDSCWDGDLLVFKPPDGGCVPHGLMWYYDRRLQIGEPMERPELERRALGNRVSIIVPSGN
jgi:hypothetical protein